MSIGMVVEDDDWSADFSERRITKIGELLDVSVVSFPASPTTSVVLADAPPHLQPDQRAADEAHLHYVASEIRKALDMAEAELADEARAAAVKHTARVLKDEMDELRREGELLRLRHGIGRPKPKPAPRSRADIEKAATIRFYEDAQKGQRR
jgi:hypothetical protein